MARPVTYCTVEGCDLRHLSRGMCQAHYTRSRRGQPLLDPIRKVAKKGAGSITWDGYRRIWAPGHPNADSSGHALEHRVIMAEMIGRPLLPNESPHHRNGVKSDNRPENLELWTTSQPKGKRVEDAIEWARMILDRYDGLEDVLK